MMENLYKKPTVLLVDDDPLCLETYAACLGKNNYELIKASGGLEALTLIRVYSIDIVITDTQMPNLDGVDLLKKLKTSRPTVPIIIFFTSYPERPEVNEDFLINMGAGRVLNKIDGFTKVLEAVEKLLKKPDY